MSITPVNDEQYNTVRFAN